MSRFGVIAMPGRAGTTAKASPADFMMAHGVSEDGVGGAARYLEVIETYGELAGQEIFYVGVTRFRVSISTAPGRPLDWARRA